MRIFHAADIHFCDKYLDEVTRCFNYAIDQADADCALLTGDLFDGRLEQNSPALMAAVDAVRKLADKMPVLILQGTFSHDAPGALDLFRRIRATYRICVIDRICQVTLLNGGQWHESRETAFGGADQMVTFGATLLVSCLPSINKGAVAAALGAENASTGVGELVAQVLAGWAPSNEAARTANIPTALISHGTVSGCVTEMGVPMAGLDHEFTTGSLFASKADAIMLGHIHKHQCWESGRQVISYSGSIGRFHYGETDDKGALLWTLTMAGASLERIITPARQYVDIDFQGLPDMQAITNAQVTGAWVRLRYTVDEEHRQAVDRDALEAILIGKGAAAVKIEPRINPIQRQRAAGIGAAPTTADQVQRWCALTKTEPAPVLERLHQLEHRA